MKVFKSKQYPTEDNFLALVAECKQYLEKLSVPANVRPRNWPPSVAEYARRSLEASRKNEDPPALEWFDMTEEEWQTQEQENQEKERKKKAEKEAKEQRKRDLAKAKEDGEFRDEFIEREMDARGFPVRKTIMMFIKKEWDEGDIDDFKQRRKNALKEIREEIKGVVR